MKKSIYIAFILVFISVSPSFASELTEYQSKPIKDAELHVIPNREAATLTTLPIYPGAKEVSGHTLKQGSFEIKGQAFETNASFKKVYKFYKKKLGKKIKSTDKTVPNGLRQSLFSVRGGSQSRNVIIEELEGKKTRISFLIFEGGGGTPGE